MLSASGCYIAIDMKSFYASVECVARGIDPLKANLLVADPSRSDQTICLAVSPALKAIGVPARPRLFEAKQAINRYEKLHHTKVLYYTATPRMAEYERVSALIYSIFLRYAAAEDIHVYSIDECFVDAAPYLHLYEETACRRHIHPAYIMAMTMIRDVLKTTGITATVGIGTNLYLAKVAMDIVAKKAATCSGATVRSPTSGRSAPERPTACSATACLQWAKWRSGAGLMRNGSTRPSGSTARS